MKFANLHLHSTYSDSQLTPTQLVLIGKFLGYHALALTDHETDGGVKEFNTFALKEGLQALSGIEFYGRDFGKSFHIVALDYDTNNPVLRAFVAERCRLRNECTRQCVERGISLGYIQGITEEEFTTLKERRLG